MGQRPPRPRAPATFTPCPQYLSFRPCRGSTATMLLMGWSGRAPPFHRRMLVERKSGARSTPMTRPSTAAVATLGIDLGKNVFHLIGLNGRGAITLRQRLSRRQLE